MPKTYRITTEQLNEIRKARENTRDKQVDKRLRAVQMRGEGNTNREIAELLETSSDVISIWVSAYAKKGIKALLPKEHKPVRFNMTYEEEAAFLADYMNQAQQGQIVEVSVIKAAYESKVGHRIGGSQIYYVLKRHGWRKIMPRSKHPNKASDEVIEASKKLTFGSRN